MKVLYTISKWAWAVMLVLYVVALIAGLVSEVDRQHPDALGALAVGMIFGFLVQFLVGVIHFVTAIVAYANYAKLQPADRNLLNGYAILCVTFFITWWMVATYDMMGLKEESGIYMLAIFPTLIGGYFVYVAHRISKSLKQTNNQDNSGILDS